jgi:hypothetical protein
MQLHYPRFSWSFGGLRRRQGWRTALLLSVLGSLALSSLAQAPAVTAVSPARNLRSAPTGSPVGVTFSQAISAASAGSVRVFSAQRGGQRVRGGGGSVSGGGTAQVQFAPAQPWQPGELVSVSVPASVQSTAGVPAAPHVFQFTAAAGSSGGGTFASGYGSEVTMGPINPRFITTGDVDGDGDLDLLTAISSQDRIRIDLNAGNGTFGAGPTISTGSNPSTITLGDVDGDGDLDMVVTVGSNATGAVSIFTNDGSGGFPSASTVLVGETLRDVALGDIDGDGDLDIATANFSNQPAISFLINGGSGTFTVGPGTLAMGSGIDDVALGDVDSDGDLDLLAVSASPGQFYVRLNNGSGTFSGSAFVTGANSAANLVLGDIDGDGDLDAVLSKTALNSSLSIYRNNGSGGFTHTSLPDGRPTLFETSTAVTVRTVPSDVAIADLDGDGDLDLVALTRINTRVVFNGSEFEGRGEIRLWTNDGSGTFSPGGATSVGIGPGSLAVGDLDGDQDLDLLANSTGFVSNATTGTVSVRLNGASVSSLTVGALGLANFCRGRSLDVPFTAVGDFDISNVFTAQLSDASGSFASPVDIGVFRGTAPGTIQGNIPAGTALGTGYRVRVVSNHLPFVGTDNGTDLTIFEFNASNIAATATPTPVAAGGTLSLDVTGSAAGLAGLTYAWTGPNAFASTLRNLQLPGVTTANDGLYRVTVTNNDCTYSSTVTVTVTPPTITAGDPLGGATQFCAGSTIAVPFTTSGPFPAGTTFSLHLTDANGTTVVTTLNGTGSGTITGIIPTSQHVSTTYRVRVTANRSGTTVVASPTDLTVTNLNLSAPALAITSNSPVAEGADLNLDVANVPLPGATFAWTGPNGFTATTQNPTVPAVTMAAGSYSVTVSLNGCTRTLSRSVSVTPTPRSTTVSPLTTSTVCAGETFSLPFTTTGAFNANNVFTAQLSNAAGSFASGITTLGTLAGTAGGTIMATLPASAAAGTAYRLRVQASSTATTGTSSSFAVSVVNLTAVAAGSNSPLEEGQTLSLTLTGDPAGATYAWTGPNGFSATTATPTLPAVTLAAGGTYSVTVTRGDCSATRTVSVVVNVAPIEVTAVSPMRNQSNAATGSPVGVTFSQAVGAASAGNVRVFSKQHGGQLVASGAIGGGGTAQASFAPAQAWRPGETVSVSVPATVRSLDGVRGVRPHVFQFTAAAGSSGGGIFGGGTNFALNGNTASGQFRINPVFADLNGDGRLDMLVASTLSGYHSINRYFNNGAGGFGAGIETRYSFFISDLTVGDVDNDGDIDFLLTEGNNDMVTIGYNDGTGTFTRTVRVPVGDAPFRTTVGDVDGDGDLDFITANGGPSGNVKLSIGRNDGAGNFVVSTTTAVPAPTREVALGDLDGDGDLDLVASQGTSVMLAVIRFNDGNGNFSGIDQLPYNGGGGEDLHLADLDKDGHLDLVIGSRTNVFVYRNNGSGGFAYFTVFPLASSVSDLAVGDINGDGNLDLLATNLSNHNCEIALNTGNGTFTPGTTLDLGDAPRGRLALGDIDGDLDLDLAAGTIVPNSVRVRLNGGTNAAPTITSFTPGSGAAGTPVVITGTNLLNITGASFNGTPVALADITNNTSTSVRLLAPAGGSTGPISVTTAGGTGSSAQSFTYLVPTTLSTDALAAGTYCAGAAISVPFTAAGSYAAGNVFTAQLSDAAGGFGAGAVNLGTLAGTAGGTISGTVPAGTGGSSLYRVRVVASSPATTAATTQSLSITAAGTVAWLGGTSTDWLTAANWSCGQVPTATDNVTIGTGATYYPVVTGTSATVRDLAVAAGASFAVTGTLTVRGSLTNNGTWTTGGSYVFAGPGPQVVGGTAPVSLGNVTITAGATVQLTASLPISGNWLNNGAFDAGQYRVTFLGTTPQTLGGSSATRFYDLTIQNAAGVSCTAPTGVAHLLSLPAGNLAADGFLTLYSNAAGTAMVVNPAGGGRVTGRATMERFITDAGSAGYRHYASPMALGTATVQEFADDLPVFELNPAYNTQGNTVTPFPTFYQYAESRLASAATDNFSQGWMTPLATDNLVPGRGYSAQTGPTTTVDISGTLSTGAVSLPLTRGGQSGSGWNLVGNPYPAPIDWDLVPAAPGLDKALYVFVPSGPYTGTYGSYVNGIGQNGGGKDVAAMQGFFVRATAATTLSLTDAVRHTSYLSPGFNRGSTTATLPLLRLHVRNAAGQGDETVVYFDPSAGAGFRSDYDAYKVQLNGNGIPSVWSQAGPDALSINGLPDLTAAAGLPLGVRVSQTGTHTLAASALLNLPAGTQVVLEDRLLNQRQNLTVDSAYSFQMAASYTGQRFYLWFQGRALATTGSSLDASAGLYPNPTTGITTLELSGLREQGAVTIEVLNALGQRVLAQSTRPRQGAIRQELAVGHLPTGVYSVRVRTAEGTVVRLLLKQ